MSQWKRSEWRRQCMDSAQRVAPRKFSSLNLDRGVDEVIESLSADEIEGLDMNEFREFLNPLDAGSLEIQGTFKENLKRELWWDLVSGLTPGSNRIPQA